MAKCRITVIKKMFNEDLAKEYCENPNTDVCEFLQLGQEFIVSGPIPNKPEGFCEEAWSAITRYVFAFTSGGGAFFDGKWMKKEDTMIACCNDGIRPVILKLERFE